MGRWPRYGPLTPPILGPWYTWPYTYYFSTLGDGNTQGLPTANAAFYYPVEVPQACVITKLFWVNGNTATGNVDIGVYTEDGQRLISTGSTAQTPALSIQEVNITDTAIPAGLLYFAIVASTTSALFNAATSTFNGLLWNCKTQASALPLPVTATFATVDTIPIPRFGALVAPRTIV